MYTGLKEKKRNATSRGKVAQGKKKYPNVWTGGARSAKKKVKNPNQPIKGSESVYTQESDKGGAGRKPKLLTKQESSKAS